MTNLYAPQCHSLHAGHHRPVLPPRPQPRRSLHISAALKTDKDLEQEKMKKKDPQGSKPNEKVALTEVYVQKLTKDIAGQNISTKKAGAKGKGPQGPLTPGKQLISEVDIQKLVSKNGIIKR